MALRQLVITKKIEALRASLAALSTAEGLFTTRAADLLKRETDLEAAVNELSPDATDDERKAVDDGVAALEADRGTLDADKNAHDEKKAGLEGEIQTLQAELDELNKKATTPPKPAESGAQRKGEHTNMEIREAINAYVRSKGQTRDGFTSVDGGALIPVELLAPYVIPKDVIDLTKLVRVVKVNSGSGKYPVITMPNGKMVSVAELEKNPKLAKPNIDEVSYDIETYRGYIPVSQESIDDADYDIAGLIAEGISLQDLNTRNAAIAAILKTAAAKAATGLDGLKEIFNVKISRVYSAKAVISASLYNELDTIKDNNGRYLMQDDITVASGKRLFGHEVVVLDDDIIGDEAGDMVGFMGDPYAFCALFDRARASVKWVDNDVYGQLLAGFVRFDVGVTDPNAGYFVTYTREA